MFCSEARRLVIAGGGDDCAAHRRIRTYDVETLEKTADLDAHDANVRMVRFSPDGSLVASCGVDAKVKLWDPVSWELVAELVGHERNVQDVAFSPDGELLLSAGLDGTPRVWQVATGRQVTAFEGHLEERDNGDRGHWVSSVCFSPDGRLAVTGSRTGTIRIWDPRGGEHIAESRSPDYGAVNFLTFTPDGMTLISVHWQGQVLFTRSGDWCTDSVVEAHTARTHGHAMTPDGCTLVTGCWGREIKLWDVPSRAQTGAIRLSL
ncbi:MAG: WD40 repeat domain-containing protein [Candidatus Latescibacteria bacterium]|jgi:WD40 repeat protein|nr:WD40 repeat domain-containing protein [Candidatus Latescibacterota bacterium]